MLFARYNNKRVLRYFNVYYNYNQRIDSDTFTYK